MVEYPAFQLDAESAPKLDAVCSGSCSGSGE